jgi:hypothetical protein
MSQAAMSDPAVPAPPLAAAVSATERQAGGAPQTPARASFCLQPSDLPRSARKRIAKYCHAEGSLGRRRAADPRAASFCLQPSDFPRSGRK